MRESGEGVCDVDVLCLGLVYCWAVINKRKRETVDCSSGRWRKVV